MPSLDRFAVGLKDPQEDEPNVIGKCECGCGEEIIAGYESIDYDGMWFAEEKCLMNHIGAEWRVAE